jgi:hypothetical protein
MGGVVRTFRKLVAPSRDPAAPLVRAFAAKQSETNILENPDSIGNPIPVLAPEVEAPPAITEQETLLKKKKKGRYGTLLTGGKGALGGPDIEKKSLLGS